MSAVLRTSRSVLVVGAIAVLLGLGSASAAGAKPRVTTHMYGDRYCEILAVKGTVPNLVADVWNTYGLNACPSARWKAQDQATVTKDLGALTVRLNGPRYWLIDHASITLAPGLGQIRSFSGLRMRRIAQVQVPITNGVPGLPAYTPTTVLRDNTFTWSKKHQVHELVAADGAVYVMQAYSQIVDPALPITALPTLGSRLQLPTGWTYRNRTLRRDLSLTTTGKAIVLQDELQNTYQLERKG